MVTKLFDPKPLRKKEFWKQFEAVEKSNPAPLATAKMTEAALITCRDCFGFGHTMKKCPTGRKFNKYREGNKLLRVVISRARAKLANNVHQGLTDNDWFFNVSATADVAPLVHNDNTADKAYVKEFILKMQALVCGSCSGWGHKTTCYRAGKNKQKLGCPT
jgi:hypothetical protein